MGIRLSVAIVLLAACIACTPNPQAVQQSADHLPQLEKRISIHQKGNLYEIVETLRRALGVNIVVDPRCRDGREVDENREIVLRDIKGYSAIRWIAALYELDVVIRDGAAVISCRNEFDLLHPRLYETSGIMRPIHSLNRSRLNILHQEGLLGFSLITETPHPATNRKDILAELVKEHISPGTWEGRATVESVPAGGLVVTHSATVHRQLSQFLDALKILSATPTITITARIIDADKGTDSLISGDGISVFGPGEVEKVATRFASASSRCLTVTASPGQRCYSTSTAEESRIIDLQKDGEVFGNWTHEAEVLGVCPSPAANGRFVSVELRLDIGKTRDRPPFKIGERQLPLTESSVVSLETNLLVPNGGGVILVLPPDSFAGRPARLCLLKASTRSPPSRSPLSFDIDLGETDPSLDDRLDKLPSLSPALEDVTLDQFAKWLRESTGMNVVLAPDLKGSINLQGKDLRPAQILSLVLEPQGLGAILRDEAIFITHLDRANRAVRMAIREVRDLECRPRDFYHPGHECVSPDFSGEDLANVVKNNIHRERWAEVDGASVVYENGALLIRNTPEILRACDRFLNSLRAETLRIVTIQANVLVVPASKAEAILGPPGKDTCLIDKKQYGELSGAGVQLQQLVWHAREGQVTNLSWDRNLAYVQDFKQANDPLINSEVSSSYLQVRGMILKEGSSIRLEIDYADRDFAEVRERRCSTGEVIQVPLKSQFSTTGAVLVPEEKQVVFRWSLPSREGEAPRLRLLVLKPGWRRASS